MKLGRKGSLAVIGLLIIAIAMAAPAVSALQDLKVTSDNLATLQSLTYQNRNVAWYSYGNVFEPLLLKYDYGKALNTFGKSKTAVYVGTRKAIKIGDGQCVDFAKAVTNSGGIASTNWKTGRLVMDIGNYGDLAQGTAVATFSSKDKYGGHVAIFDSWHWVYVSGTNWKIDGFYAWDENYVAGSLVGRHLFKQSGTGLDDADAYSVIQIT